MKRKKLIEWKEVALDRMFLCAGVFHGNKPPSQAQCIEMSAHAALVQALCLELGPPLPVKEGPMPQTVEGALKILHDHIMRNGKLFAQDETRLALRHLTAVLKGGDA